MVNDFDGSIPILITLGAIPGAIARYYLTLVCIKKMGLSFPYGTTVINISGSFLIGFCSVLIQSLSNSVHINSFLIIGFLGSYTTFSTYELDSANLFRTGYAQTAILY
ncbi:MAG TPA: fluoride efflux transporter CrcB, partial [Coleofasciculaceae cyanobacterium]